MDSCHKRSERRPRIPLFVFGVAARLPVLAAVGRQYIPGPSPQPTLPLLVDSLKESSMGWLERLQFAGPER